MLSVLARNWTNEVACAWLPVTAPAEDKAGRSHVLPLYRVCVAGCEGEGEIRVFFQGVARHTPRTFAK